MQAAVLMPLLTAIQLPCPAAGPITRQPDTSPISAEIGTKAPNCVPSDMCGLKTSAAKKASTAKAKAANSFAAVGI